MATAADYGLSEQDYQQLQLYAAMSGMSVDDYIAQQTRDQGSQQIQAPQRSYESKGGGDYIDPTDEATIEQSWNNGPRQQGVTLDDYKKQVKARYPNGGLQQKIGLDRAMGLTGQDFAASTLPTTSNGVMGPTTQPVDPVTNGLIRSNSVKATSTAGSSPQQDAISAALSDNLQKIGDVSKQSAQKQEDYFNNNVQPALGRFTGAQQDQITADRAAEQQLQAGGNALNSSLDANQAQRMAAINSTNAAQSAGLATYQGQLGQANARQDAALGALQGQLSASNAAESAAYGGYQNKLDASNNAMSTANDQFQHQLINSNAQATANVDAFGRQLNDLSDQSHNNYGQLAQGLAALNEQDQAGYQKYLQNTDPLLAAQQAQGSNAQDVQQQQDVYNKYNALSNPEVTAQERFLAEAARQKTEQQDKSSRDATYAQLQARGLNSGGQQIAAQLANRQSTSQDRVLAELGLQASSVGRSMQAMQGAQGAANSLRNADDAMRQFQDQYAQNDAIRRQGVAQGQANTGLATTGQIGQRQNDRFNASRADINDNTTRAGMGYGARNDVINSNSNRNAQGFGANASTINSNSARDTQGFNANVGMINDNSNRNVTGYNASTQTNNDNTSRNTAGYNALTDTNNTNFSRTSGGLATADRNAGTAYGTIQNNTNLSTGNRGAEAGTAGQGVGLGIAASGAYGQTQQGLTQAQIDALNLALGGKIVKQAQQDDEKNV